MNIRHIAAVSAFILLTACSDVAPYGDQWVDAYFLRVDESSIQLDSQGKGTIQVSATNDLSWSIYRAPEWIGWNESGGQGNRQLTFYSKEDNPETTPREATVELSSHRYDKQASFKIIQEGTYLQTNTNELYFPTTGSSSNFEITTNAHWQLQNIPSWASASINNGERGKTQVEVTVNPNPKGDERSGKLIVKTANGAINKTIDLIQASRQLTVKPEELRFPPEGNVATFDVSCNDSWTVRSSDYWCSVTPTYGSNDGTITVTIGKYAGYYDQTSYITVQSGDVSRTVRVVQANATLSVDSRDAQQYFAPEGGRISLPVTSNTEWNTEVNSNARGWCHVSQSTVSGNGVVTVSIDKHTGADERKAMITVSAGALKQTFEVKQTGVSLSVKDTRGQDSHTFNPDKGSERFEVVCNSDWTVSSNADWCNVSPTKGSGDGSFLLEVTPYTGTSTPRTATLTVKAGEVTRTVTITQQNTTLSLKPADTMSFGPLESSYQLTITANTAWTLSSNAQWCKLGQQEGSGEATVSVMVSANPEVTPRTATLTAQTKNGAKKATLSITQQGKEIILTVSPQTINIGAIGGTQAIEVKCNTYWTATVENNWFTLSDTEGNLNKTITVTVPQNTKQQSLPTSILFKAGDKSSKVTIIQAGATPPSIESLAIKPGSVGRNEVTFTFNCISDFPISECGICYSSTNNTPTTGNSVKKATVSNSSVTVGLSGLESGTTYYVRAYAISVAGQSYSDKVITVTTLGGMPGDDDNPVPNPR